MQDPTNQLIVTPLLGLLVFTAITVARMRDLWAAVMLTGIYSFLGAGWMLVLDAPDVAFTEAAVGAGISTVLMLSTLALTSRTAKPPREFPGLAVIVVTVTGAALLYGTLDMPNYGDPNAPIHNHPKPGYMDIALSQRASHGSDEAQAATNHSDGGGHTDHSTMNHAASDHGPTTPAEQSADHGVQQAADADHHDADLHTDEHEHEHHEPVPNIVTVVLASYRGFDTLGETSVIFTAGIAVMLLLRGRREEGSES